jgi:hypothetical protein
VISRVRRASQVAWRRLLEGSAIADDFRDTWVEDILKFWFEQTDQWFRKDSAFDVTVREGFLGLHEDLMSRGINDLVADAQTALAAVIVLDQMSVRPFAIDIRKDHRIYLCFDIFITAAFSLVAFIRPLGRAQLCDAESLFNRDCPRTRTFSGYPSSHWQLCPLK